MPLARFQLSAEFQGTKISGHAVEGTYFNDIAADLRKTGEGTPSRLR